MVFVERPCGMRYTSHRGEVLETCWEFGLRAQKRTLRCSDLFGNYILLSTFSSNTNVPLYFNEIYTLVIKNAIDKSIYSMIIHEALEMGVGKKC